MGDNPQELVQCPHCVSTPKASKLSLHIGRVHRNVQGKQQCVLNADHKVDDLHQHLEEDCSAMAELKKNAYDSSGISTVPPLTKCTVDFGPEVENWDNSDFPTYKPLESTNDKNIIRGFYLAGLTPLEKKNAVLEERNRRAALTEKQNKRHNQISNSKQNNFDTSTGFPVLTESRSNYPTTVTQSRSKDPIPSYKQAPPAQRGNRVNSNTANYNSRAPASSGDGNYYATKQPPARQNYTETNSVTTDSDGYTVVRRGKGVGRGRGRGQK